MASVNPNEICLICEKPLGTDSEDKKTKVLKISGIKTLIKSSIAKGDTLHQKLKKLSEINIHDSCRSQYNRPPNANRKPQPEKGPCESRLSKPSTRSNKVEEFIFTTSCFLCGSDAGPTFLTRENKKELGKRREVSRVTNSGTTQLILTVCDDRGDYEASLVHERIKGVPSLTDVDARYHEDCYRKFLQHPGRGKHGRPADPTLEKVTEFIIQYVIENDDDCQFSMKEIITQSGGKITDFRLIQEKLKTFFHERIILTNIKGNTIITYLERSKTLLSNSWRKKAEDDDKEKEKIVLAAAEIILDDIKKKLYDTNHYRSPSHFLDQIHSDIPTSLKLLLDTVMKGKKKNSKKWENRVCVCSSYSETLPFQASLIKHPQSYSITDAYFKFVSDNADQNKRTIDGYGTFHVLGNIQIVNPASSVTSEELIPRLKQLPSAAELGKAGVWELQKYHSSMKDGLKNVIMKVVGHGKDKSPLDLFNSRDLAWLYGKSHKPLETKGWNAFMAMVCELQEYQTSRVLSLPIVNNPPSDYDTIYTALLYADREARRRNQMHVFCTFDHPLYMISGYIIENQDPKKPRLRCLSSIGIFHLLMSVSKSISSTMDGSGLKEVLGLIFAENSLEAILSGKAYDRAMRGHKLVLNGISTLIFREIEFSSEELSTINELLTGMDKPDFDVMKVLHCDVMELMTQKFLSACKSLEKRSPTAKLSSLLAF
ncbi:hypothetical protein QAD02_024103 [Eretmocerus hayati]|uniref:Uncharacterized protein n=1 Tax=Eretmocerus hayati TaxID=131215 RepID=A0ACC2PYV7_9HYME|nr:hypothetical protein QAD02_024103 [Eretmocerus hayati]